MKQLFTLFLCLCLSVINTYAKQKIAGYYVTQRNDTIRGTFLVPFGFLGSEPSYERLQHSVKFLDANGEKYAILPMVVKCFVLDFAGTKITYLSRKDVVSSSLFSSGRAMFFKLKMDGPLKVFEYYVRRYSGGSPNRDYKQ